MQNINVFLILTVYNMIHNVSNIQSITQFVDTMSMSHMLCLSWKFSRGGRRAFNKQHKMPHKLQVMSLLIYFLGTWEYRCL